MPKKTRQQKIRAALRQEKPDVYTFEYQPKRSVAIAKTQSSQQIVHTDIGKTLILGILIIGFEILVYFYSKRFGW